MDKKNMTKAVEPVHVKIEKVGDTLSGKLISVEQSTKFDDGYAIKYTNEDDVLSVAFINKLAKDLFINNDVVNGDEFLLTYTEDRENAEKKFKYRVYELLFKKVDKE